MPTRGTPNDEGCSQQRDAQPSSAGNRILSGEHSDGGDKASATLASGQDRSDRV
jgi:hypothetical protein